MTRPHTLGFPTGGPASGGLRFLFSDYGTSISVPKPTVTAGAAAGPTADGSAPSIGAGLSTPGGGIPGAPSPSGTP